MDAPLQPLRVPSGWKIEFNSLFEIDPVPDLIPPDHHSWFFKEDLLQMKNEDRNRLLDVGWFPDGNLERGEYAVHIHEGDWHGCLLHEFRTQNRLSVVAEIERLLVTITTGQL